MDGLCQRPKGETVQNAPVCASDHDLLQAEREFDVSIEIVMMSSMRTTLTFDPDVEQLLQEEMRRTNRSRKAVVNDALRIGLGMLTASPRVPPFEVEPHAFGFRPGTDSDRLNQLVDEMEADDFARKQVR